MYSTRDEGNQIDSTLSQANGQLICHMDMKTLNGDLLEFLVLVTWPSLRNMVLWKRNVLLFLLMKEIDILNKSTLSEKKNKENYPFFGFVFPDQYILVDRLFFWSPMPSIVHLFHIHSYHFIFWTAAGNISCPAGHSKKRQIIQESCSLQMVIRMLI